MSFSHFFVRRPIFAGVLSAIIFIAGAHLAAAACRSANTPRSCRRPWSCARRIPGANPQDHRRNRRGAARAGDQRRRELALHVLAVDGRRRDDADRHVQARHRPRQGAGAGAEPRLAGPAEAARGSAAARRDDREGVARPHDGRAPVLAGRALRHALSAQLRDAASAGRARAHRGRRRGAGVRLRRLRDARVARPGQGRGAQPHRERRRARDPRAERAGRRGRSRPAAGAERGRLRALDQRARAASSPRRSSATSS